MVDMISDGVCILIGEECIYPLIELDKCENCPLYKDEYLDETEDEEIEWMLASEIV